MNIIVCVKQVPETNKVKIDPNTGTLIREGIPTFMNPDDKHALLEAVRIKNEKGGKVIALSMGPPQAEETLREALALGADEAILLCDRAFAGSDTWATSIALGYAIQKIKDYDLLLFGRQAIDGETAHVGPETAEFLDIPQITYAQNIEVDGGKVKVERQLEDGYEIIESFLPCLVTCSSDINELEYPKLNGIKEAYRNKEVKVWNAADIKVDKSKIGLENSPTSVLKTFSPSAKGQGQILKGSSKEVAGKVVSILKEKELIGGI